MKKAIEPAAIDVSVWAGCSLENQKFSPCLTKRQQQLPGAIAFYLLNTYFSGIHYRVSRGKTKRTLTQALSARKNLGTPVKRYVQTMPDPFLTDPESVLRLRCRPRKRTPKHRLKTAEYRDSFLPIQLEFTMPRNADDRSGRIQSGLS